MQNTINPDRKLIAIFGPTVTNKTGLAIQIAKHVLAEYGLRSELVSADPRKVYKDLNTGQTAVWTSDQARFPVHLTNFIDSLDQELTLYEYKNLADKTISEIHGRGHLPIIYGGGATWISSVLENWHVPPPNTQSRDFKKDFGRGEQKYDYLLFVPQVGRSTLWNDIAAHVNLSFKRGIINEVSRLTQKYKINPLARHTSTVLSKSLEYRQILEYCAYVRKKPSRLNPTDIAHVKRQTINALKDYARRQAAWIPKMSGKVHLISHWKESREVIEQFLAK